MASACDFFIDRNHLSVEFGLEQIFELLDSQASIADDCRHRIRIDWIVAWNDDSQRAFGHEHMFTLSIDMEARFLQRFNRAQMINAGQLRHQLRRDYFHFADFTTRIRFSVEIDVAANRVFDICKRVFYICTLRVASG